jgi:hypothetical protein
MARLRWQDAYSLIREAEPFEAGAEGEVRAAYYEREARGFARIAAENDPNVDCDNAALLADAAWALARNARLGGGGR